MAPCSPATSLPGLPFIIQVKAAVTRHTGLLHTCKNTLWTLDQLPAGAWLGAPSWKDSALEHPGNECAVLLLVDARFEGGQAE